VRFSFVELAGDAAGEPSAKAAASLPRAFGDYQVVEELARGCMGVVYRARQTSLHRTVALKMVAAGQLASPSAIRRFKTEAEAAANLDHPNIVPIYEIGEYAGQHYFTMKLIEGASLAQRLGEFTLDRPDATSAQKAASLRKQALKLSVLLARVAEAVHYAHQRGILHRDLKPGNILIDREDQPHVTDFGLAKRVEADSHLTLSGEIMGTPAYMSPEQAAGNLRQVTTAADVFSLGVILYQLLTGRVPFAGKTPVEVFHAVIHEEPPAPRLVNPAVLRDLETICLKCLEKDPTKRFATAKEVADELHRFVAGEPIQARPVSRTERVWRWSRRNPALAGFAAATILLLLTVLIGAPIAVWRESTLRRRAEAEAVKSQQVAKFLKSMLEGVGPSVSLGRDATLLQEILDKTAERVGTELNGQPDVEAELRTTLGQVYEALGQYGQAEKMHRLALASREENFGSEHPQVARSLNGLAMALRSQGGKLEQALPLMKRALAMQKRLLPQAHLDTAQSLNDLALLLQDKGDPKQLPEAERLQQESIAMLRELQKEDDKQVAMAMNNLAANFAYQGRWSEAVVRQQEALDLQRKLLEPNHPDIAQSLNNLSIFQVNAGDLAGAAASARDALDMRKKLLDSEHPYLATSYNNLASVLWKDMKLDEAETNQRAALAIQIQATSPTHPESLKFLSNLGTILSDAGNYAAAEAMHLQVLAVRTNVFGFENVPVAESLNNLARVLCDTGRYAEAEDLYQRSLDVLVTLLNPNDPNIATLLVNLAVAQSAQGNFEAAETNHLKALAIRREVFAADHPFVAQSLNSLGQFYREASKPAEAETNLLQALAICQRLPLQHELLLAATLENLILVQLDRNESTAVVTRVQQSLEIRKRRLPDNWRKFSTQALLGRALLAQSQRLEAEPLLVAGCQGMKERLDQIPAPSVARYREAVACLVELYEATRRPDAAARWRSELISAASK
jgi:tetratricopeptide (TPR) repeat protein